MVGLVTGWWVSHCVITRNKWPWAARYAFNYGHSEQLHPAVWNHTQVVRTSATHDIPWPSKPILTMVSLSKTIDSSWYCRNGLNVDSLIHRHSRFMPAHAYFSIDESYSIEKSYSSCPSSAALFTSPVTPKDSEQVSNGHQPYCSINHWPQWFDWRWSWSFLDNLVVLLEFCNAQKFQYIQIYIYIYIYIYISLFPCPAAYRKPAIRTSLRSAKDWT